MTSTNSESMRSLLNDTVYGVIKTELTVELRTGRLLFNVVLHERINATSDIASFVDSPRHRGTMTAQKTHVNLEDICSFSEGS